MTKRKDLIVVSLATFCLTASLFMVGSIRSSPGIGEYNPWADINNDGTVDIFDAILLAGSFKTVGQNTSKASVAYDSGWLNITDKAGQNIVISHDLGISDWNDESIMVEITGKTSVRSLSSGGLLRRLGLHQLQAWNATYGGAGNDDAWALVQTDDSGYALAGRTVSFGAGNMDFWLVRTDAVGYALWNKTYGGAGDDFAWALVQTGDGGYALAGLTESYGAGGYDFWLVKTDADGNALWNKTYGGLGSDQACALVQEGEIFGWSAQMLLATNCGT